MNRYACSQVARHFDEVEVVGRWVDVWYAALATSGHPATANIGFVDIATIRAAEKRYGHDVVAACETLREAFRECGDEQGAQWLHYGLCSSDVADAGLWLTTKEVTGELVDLLEVAMAGLDELGRRWPGQTVHRTHGQAAQVGPGITRWGRHSQNFAAAKRYLEVCQKRLSLPAFNGPTGNGGELTLNQRRRLREALAGSSQGAGSSAAGQNVGRDDYVAWAEAVSRVATACERFGRDVRLLAMTGEMVERRGGEYRGSSSMPHKLNPTRSERLCGLAATVRGLVSGYREAAAECWDAHSLEHSSAERVVLPQISELTGFMLQEVHAISTEAVILPVMVEFWVERLPTDSYARRNALVAAGADPDEAYEALRGPDVEVTKLYGPE